MKVAGRNEFKKEYEFCGIFKKISHYFLDAFLLIVSSMLLAFASVNILELTPSYSATSSSLNGDVSTLYSLESEANLIDLIGLDGEEKEEPISREDMFTKYIDRHIALSSKIDDHGDFSSSGVGQYQSNYGEASTANDYLAYFYIDYKSIGQIEEEEQNKYEFFYSLLIENLSTNYWVYEGGQLPHLDSRYALDIYHYIAGEKNTSGETIYNDIETSFETILDDSLTIFSTGNEDFVTHYASYLDKYSLLTRYSLLATFITMVLAYSIFFIIVPLFFKKKELSDYILKMELTPMNDGGKIDVLRFILGKVITFTSLFWTIFFISLISTKQYGLVMTLFSIGSRSINMLDFIFLSMILAIVYLLIASLNKDKRLPSESISGGIYLSYKKTRDFGALLSEK
jgi:hypothetical protein